MRQPTLGSLFAGIGGIDLGFERAGFKTVWQVEINPFCRNWLPVDSAPCQVCAGRVSSSPTFSPDPFAPKGTGKLCGSQGPTRLHRA